MKKGFVEYVNFYRVEEAKRLLRNGNDKIAYVCAEAGFGSTQTFYTAFKNFERLTPSEYRKACGKETSTPPPNILYKKWLRNIALKIPRTDSRFLLVNDWSAVGVIYNC